MFWLWIPPMGKPDKKAVFSSCFGDETTIYYDRAKCKNKIPIIYCGASIEKETLFLFKGALSLLKPASTGYILPHDKLSCLFPFRHAVKMRLPYSMAGFFIGSVIVCGCFISTVL